MLNETNENISFVSCPPFGVLIVGSKLSSTIYLAVFCCTCLISVVSTLLNALVLVALLASRLKRTQSLLIMLNVGDLLVGLILLPLYAVYMHGLRYGTIDCVLGRALMVIGYSITMITCLNIAFLTLQLYRDIINPFKHQHWSSVSNHIILSFCWIVTSASISTIVLAFPEFWDIFQFVVGGVLFIIYCIMLVAHNRVYTETKQITKNKHDYKTNGMVMKKKTFKMVSTILLAFGLTYIPFVLFAVYVGIHGINPVLRSFYAPLIEIMAMSSALLDPLIYCFRLKSIRHEVIRVLNCRCQQNANLHHKHQSKFEKIKQHTGLTMNSVNLSILTSSMTSMSSIRFNHESKYRDTEGNNNHHIICHTLSQPLTSLTEKDETLDKFHREQASVLRKAKYLYVP